MEYTVRINMLVGLLVGIAFFFVPFLVAFLLSRRLAKGENARAAGLPFLICVCLLLYAFVAWEKGFIGLGAYYLNSGRPQAVSVGQIEDAAPGPVFPVFFDPVSATVCRGEYLTVDGIAYFFPGNCLQVGQWVKLAYTEQDHVVCSWQLLSEEVGKASKVTGAMLAQPPVSEGRSIPAAAYIVWYVSFALIVLTVLLQHLLGNQIAAWLRAGDEAHTDGVRPSSFGLAVYCTVLPFLGLLIGWRLSGQRNAGFLLAGLVAAGMISFCAKRSTRAVCSGNTLTITKWRRTRAYPLDQIRDIQWHSGNLPFARRLVIMLHDGSLVSFEQEHFWGLTDLHKKICEGIQMR